MIQCRNITRAFLLQRTITKFAKRTSKLNQTELFILQGFNLVGGDQAMVSVSKVDEVLARCNRSTNGEQLYSACVVLMGKGYLISNNSKPLKYKLSVGGINALRQLEKMARLERWDR